MLRHMRSNLMILTPIALMFARYQNSCKRKGTGRVLASHSIGKQEVMPSVINGNSRRSEELDGFKFRLETR